MKIVLRCTISWIGLAVIAIVNGAIREKGYGQFIGELTAHQLSTAIVIALFGGCITILTRRWKIESSGQSLAIGGLWLALTIPFEFIFGHYVIGHPWGRLFHDLSLARIHPDERRQEVRFSLHPDS